MSSKKFRKVFLSFSSAFVFLCAESQCMENSQEENKSFLSTVTRLDFASMKIGDELAKAISIGIKNNTVLTYVDLNHNDIKEEGIKHLALSMANKPITQFHISGNKIGDTGHVLLAEAIKTWHGLTHLDVNNTDFGDTGANALKISLKGKKLAVFHFNVGNKLSEQGKMNLFLN